MEERPSTPSSNTLLEDITNETFEIPTFEVKLEDNGLYECHLFDVLEDEVEVQLLNGVIISAPYTKLRYSRKIALNTPLEPGDIVEVLVEKDEEGSASGWYRATITSAKGSKCVTKLIDDENDKIKKVVIVEVDKVRPLRNDPPVDKDSFIKFYRNVTENFQEWYKNPELHTMLCKCIKAIVVRYHCLTSSLMIISDDNKSKLVMDVLEDIHQKFATDNCGILERIDYANKFLEEIGIIRYAEEFTVDSKYVGHALGPLGQNIRDAQKVEGVRYVHFLNDTGTFQIFGDNEDAVKEARDFIDYRKSIIRFPARFAAQMIGTGGALIQEAANVCDARMSILSRTTKDDKYTDIEVTGSLKSIEMAEWLLSTRLTHLEEKEIELELQQGLNKTFMALIQPIVASKKLPTSSPTANTEIHNSPIQANTSTRGLTRGIRRSREGGRSLGRIYGIGQDYSTQLSRSFKRGPGRGLRRGRGIERTRAPPRRRGGFGRVLSTPLLDDAASETLSHSSETHTETSSAAEEQTTQVVRDSSPSPSEESPHSNDVDNVINDIVISDNDDLEQVIKDFDIKSNASSETEQIIEDFDIKSNASSETYEEIYNPSSENENEDLVIISDNFYVDCFDGVSSNGLETQSLSDNSKSVSISDSVPLYNVSQAVSCVTNPNLSAVALITSAVATSVCYEYVVSMATNIQVSSYETASKGDVIGEETVQALKESLETATEQQAHGKSTPVDSNIKGDEFDEKLAQALKESLEIAIEQEADGKSTPDYSNINGDELGEEIAQSLKESLETSTEQEPHGKSTPLPSNIKGNSNIDGSGDAKKSNKRATKKTVKKKVGFVDVQEIPTEQQADGKSTRVHSNIKGDELGEETAQVLKESLETATEQQAHGKSTPVDSNIRGDEFDEKFAQALKESLEIATEQQADGKSTPVDSNIKGEEFDEKIAHALKESLEIAIEQQADGKSTPVDSNIKGDEFDEKIAHALKESLEIAIEQEADGKFTPLPSNIKGNSNIYGSGVAKKSKRRANKKSLKKKVGFVDFVQEIPTQQQADGKSTPIHSNINGDELGKEKAQALKESLESATEQQADGKSTPVDSNIRGDQFDEKFAQALKESLETATEQQADRKSTPVDSIIRGDEFDEKFAQALKESLETAIEQQADGKSTPVDSNIKGEEFDEKIAHALKESLEIAIEQQADGKFTLLPSNIKGNSNIYGSGEAKKSKKRATKKSLKKKVGFADVQEIPTEQQADGKFTPVDSNIKGDELGEEIAQAMKESLETATEHQAHGKSTPVDSNIRGDEFDEKFAQALKESLETATEQQADGKSTPDYSNIKGDELGEEIAQALKESLETATEQQAHGKSTPVDSNIRGDEFDEKFAQALKESLETATEQQADGKSSPDYSNINGDELGEEIAQSLKESLETSTEQGAHGKSTPLPSNIKSNSNIDGSGDAKKSTKKAATKKVDFLNVQEISRKPYVDSYKNLQPQVVPSCEISELLISKESLEEQFITEDLEKPGDVAITSPNGIVDTYSNALIEEKENVAPSPSFNILELAKLTALLAVTTIPVYMTASAQRETSYIIPKQTGIKGQYIRQTINSKDLKAGDTYVLPGSIHDSSQHVTPSIPQNSPFTILEDITNDLDFTPTKSSQHLELGDTNTLLNSFDDSLEFEVQRENDASSTEEHAENVGALLDNKECDNKRYDASDKELPLKIEHPTEKQVDDPDKTIALENKSAQKKSSNRDVSSIANVSTEKQAENGKSAPSKANDSTKKQLQDIDGIKSSEKKSSESSSKNVPPTEKVSTKKQVEDAGKSSKCKSSKGSNKDVQANVKVSKKKQVEDSGKSKSSQDSNEDLTSNGKVSTKKQSQNTDRIVILGTKSSDKESSQCSNKDVASNEKVSTKKQSQDSDKTKSSEKKSSGGSNKDVVSNEKVSTKKQSHDSDKTNTSEKKSSKGSNKDVASNEKVSTKEQSEDSNGTESSEKKTTKGSNKNVTSNAKVATKKQSKDSYRTKGSEKKSSESCNKNLASNAKVSTKKQSQDSNRIVILGTKSSEEKSSEASNQDVASNAEVSIKNPAEDSNTNVALGTKSSKKRSSEGSKVPPNEKVSATKHVEDSPTNFELGRKITGQRLSEGSGKDVPSNANDSGLKITPLDTKCSKKKSSEGSSGDVPSNTSVPIKKQNYRIVILGIKSSEKKSSENQGVASNAEVSIKNPAEDSNTNVALGTKSSSKKSSEGSKVPPNGKVSATKQVEDSPTNCEFGRKIAGTRLSEDSDKNVPSNVNDSAKKAGNITPLDTKCSEKKSSEGSNKNSKVSTKKQSQNSNRIVILGTKRSEEKSSEASNQDVASNAKVSIKKPAEDSNTNVALGTKRSRKKSSAGSNVLPSGKVSTTKQIEDSVTNVKLEPKSSGRRLSEGSDKDVPSNANANGSAGKITPLGAKCSEKKSSEGSSGDMPSNASVPIKKQAEDSGSCVLLKTGSSEKKKCSRDLFPTSRDGIPFSFGNEVSVKDCKVYNGDLLPKSSKSDDLGVESFATELSLSSSEESAGTSTESSNRATSDTEGWILMSRRSKYSNIPVLAAKTPINKGLSSGSTPTGDKGKSVKDARKKSADSSKNVKPKNSTNKRV